MVRKIKGEDKGIELLGHIGITSRMADVLRKEGVPPKIRDAE
jgi:hypothetical protein